MRSTRRLATNRSIGRLGRIGTRLFTGNTLHALLIAGASLGLIWLVWIYGNGLRDPRYLDGWFLAGGMLLQLAFHIAIKTAVLSPRSARRWRRIHILAGYLLIAGFVSHCDFSLPDSVFEWTLWSAFVLVTATGIFGTYLAWSLPARHGYEGSIGAERIGKRRNELAAIAKTAMARNDRAVAATFLPALPDDAWLADLYANRLRDFFQGRRNLMAHLVGSQRPLKRLTDEIDTLSRYADKRNQAKLATIKDMVIEKDRLDFASVYLGLTKGWLFIHVPVTYALITLTAVHILVVYAYSSGDW